MNYLSCKKTNGKRLAVPPNAQDFNLFVAEDDPQKAIVQVLCNDSTSCDTTFPIAALRKMTGEDAELVVPRQRAHVTPPPVLTLTAADGMSLLGDLKVGGNMSVATSSNLASFAIRADDGPAEFNVSSTVAAAKMQLKTSGAVPAIYLQAGSNLKNEQLVFWKFGK